MRECEKIQRITSACYTLICSNLLKYITSLQLVKAKSESRSHQNQISSSEAQSQTFRILYHKIERGYSSKNENNKYKISQFHATKIEEIIPNRKNLTRIKADLLEKKGGN